ncbi:MAG: M15 family metallopeptidase [Nitrospirae bacterium]|nr:M15 family metallopeptidase [Nitrospirota bacterium]
MLLGGGPKAATRRGSDPDATAKPNLVDVSRVVPSLVVHMRYAGDRNLFHKAVYPANRCLLREKTAERLVAVAKTLHAQGFRLKVWDCYRPRSIQYKMWEIVPNPDFVADPKKGSNHNRGAAVDITLTDLSGADVPMPTDHDDFSEKAQAEYADLPEAVRQNREVLKKAMLNAGFTTIRTEWWHFDDEEKGRYDLLDVPLESLSK